MAQKNKDPEKIDRGRRQFLKATGVVPIAAGVAGSAVLEAQTGPAIVGPGEVPIELMVNGRRIALRVEPRMTLLNAIRDKADITGNKRGCDRGVCGACTMIIDGRTAYSCSTLAIETVGKQIRTVDGLADGSKLHPVQQAFCDRDALMCGFCTPGFVMATVALLEKTPKPTVEQIKKGLDGNICRCGTFVRIQEAALSASNQRLAPNTLGLGVTRG
jgi:xanthine dehydrogenase YagT iron-sulfur-binding subunit